MSVIGICGNARSGKDTMASLLSEILNDKKIKNRKTSFANSLKKECKDFVFNTLGIDVFTENTEEKNIIRPLLVTWGTHVRRKLDPDVWIKKVLADIDPNEVTIISDVRFKNEFDWIRSQKSYLFFVDRIDENGTLVPPANQDELENNEYLKNNCDFHLCWATCGAENISVLKEIVENVFTKTVSTETVKLWTQTYL